MNAMKLVKSRNQRILFVILLSGGFIAARAEDPQTISNKSSKSSGSVLSIVQGLSASIRIDKYGRSFSMDTRHWPEGDDAVALEPGPKTGSPVKNAIFCMNGKALASGGNDGTIRVRHMRESWLNWNSYGMALPVTGSPATSVACDQAGTNYASGHEDGTVSLQGVVAENRAIDSALKKGRRNRVEMLVHSGVVRKVLFSPDMRSLFSAGEDGAIHQLELNTFTDVPFYRAESGGLVDIAISDDGATLAAVADDGALHFFDITSRREISPLKQTGRAPVKAIAFSADGRWFVFSWGGNHIQLIDWKSGDERAQLGAPDDEAQKLAFSLNGDFLASAGAGGDIRLWNTAQGRLQKLLTGHAGAILSLSFSPDGDLLASTGADNIIRVFRTPETAKAKLVASEPPKDDVDTPPLAKAVPDSEAYAVVIGVEKYRLKSIPEVTYAARDAQTMHAYLTQTMGFDPKNVILLRDDEASKANMDKYLGAWLRNNVTAQSRVLVYFAGHGAPDAEKGTRYIVPHDGDPSYLDDTGYPVRRLYENLARLPAKDVRVVFDACFLGQGARSLLASGARPLVMRLEGDDGIGSNTVVIAASSGKNISTYYPDGQHGLLTQFLLKGLQGKADEDGNGRVTTEELFRYAKPRVEREARRQNVSQIPVIIPALEDLGARGEKIWTRVNESDTGPKRDSPAIK